MTLIGLIQWNQHRAKYDYFFYLPLSQMLLENYIILIVCLTK